jgi:acetylornithine/succinyldiaminopimelate/putrescine aminotransferase
MAKALGNGVPIGACWARAEVAAAFGPGDHGSTFGGQPLAAAAARATLQVMEAEDVPARAVRAGSRLRDGLLRLEGVTEVRGKGLLLGAALDVERAKEVVAAALSLGLVVNAPRPDTIRLAPPLLVSDVEIDEALDLLARALASVRSGAMGASPVSRSDARDGAPEAPSGDGAAAGDGASGAAAAVTGDGAAGGAPTETSGGGGT